MLSLLDEVGVDVEAEDDDDDDDDEKEETLSAVCLSDEDTSEDAIDNDDDDDDEEEVALPEPLAFFKGADWKSELRLVAPEMDPEFIPVTAAELEDVVTTTEGVAEGGTSADAAGVETAAGVLSFVGNPSEMDKDDVVFNDVVDI